MTARRARRPCRRRRPSVEDQVRLAWVGAFVLVLGATLVAGVLWLAVGLRGGQALGLYQAFVEESVAGLNVQAPVKYLGVDVGKVSDIDIDPQNSRRVRLRFEVRRDTPIKQDSVAVLKTQGLTGIAYVEIDGGSAGAALMPAPADGPPPTIAFKLSLGARLETVLTHVVAQIERVADNLNALFDDDNRAALKAVLADTAALARALAAEKAVLRAGIHDAARTAQSAALAAQDLAPTLARIASGAEAVQRMADGVGGASDSAARAADVAASSVQQVQRAVQQDVLPDLARLMADMQALAESLTRLSEQTTRHPSSLLLGRPPPRPGPGEPGAQP
jgi:phospholipid/cholesterol/gamma-HCH transport system substrate-binding protein